MVSNSPNVVLMINYYYPSYSKKENQAKRDFYSSKNKDDYVGYISKGIKDNLPKDYVDYMDNKEKTNGIFGKNGLMNKQDLSLLRKDLRNTKSVIWDGVISLKDEFGKKWCDSFEQAFNLMKNEFPKFLKSNNLNPDNIEWFAGLHTNTENRHIHFCFYEKRATRYRKKTNEWTYSHGKLNKNSLALFKANIENFLTDNNAKIFKARQEIAESVKTKLNNKLDRNLHNKFLQLASKLPPMGRVSYDSENMKILKQDVDSITVNVLTRNDFVKSEFEEYLLALKQKENTINSYVKRNKIKEEKQDFNKTYVKDLYRRVGNLIISHAIKLRDDGAKFKQMQVVSKKQKYYKKGKVLNQILDTMALSEKCNNEAIWCFRNHMQKIYEFERELKNREYENSFEM